MEREQLARARGPVFANGQSFACREAKRGGERRSHAGGTAWSYAGGTAF
jgi:hypothetical protein